jgi:hypothetical protein
MKLAEHAEAIVRARLRGLRPADMVIVSLVGPLAVSNPVVLARPGLAYDWRWTRALDLCLYMRDGQDWPGLLKDIALQRPAYLSLWCANAGWGAKVYLIPTADDVARPVRLWQYELDFLPWMDFENEGFKKCSW